ncbi:hypothetical protein EBR21_13135 [bacterium]|nr:hypothetical protein [bacterium]
MKKLLATAILAPLALNACGRDEDNQASQPSKQIQQLQSQKQGSNQIEELKRLGTYTESRIAPGSECDGGSRECYTR